MSYLIWRSYKFLIQSVVLVALGVSSLWWYWPEIIKRPFVHDIISWISQSPIPKARPESFTVAVLHLDQDSKGEFEHLAVEALKETEGIEVLLLDRRIGFDKCQPQVCEKNGHDTARQYLKESGAQIAIWGTIIKQGERSLPKLYLTTNESQVPPGKRYLPSTDLSLPAMFWSDLFHIIELVLVSEGKGLSTQQGNFARTQLEPYVSKVRTLLESTAAEKAWDAQTRGIVRIILADALAQLGEETRNGVLVLGSVDIYLSHK